jgi:hypothetical protein
MIPSIQGNLIEHILEKKTRWGNVIVLFFIKNEKRTPASLTLAHDSEALIAVAASFVLYHIGHPRRN